jgi:hypothetical protein
MRDGGTSDDECAVRINQLRLLQCFRVTEVEHGERGFGRNT